MEKKIVITVDIDKGTMSMKLENMYHIEVIGLLEFYKQETLVKLHHIATPQTPSSSQSASRPDEKSQR